MGNGLIKWWISLAVDLQDDIESYCAGADDFSPE